MTSLSLILLGALSAYYLSLLLMFWLGLRLHPRYRSTETPRLSVIVAARNEEKRLPALLDALAAQDYPDFEIVVADDRSTDGTPWLLTMWEQNEPRLRSVRIDHENPALTGKKGALAAAIEASDGEWLVFTDADCLPGPHWLSELAAHMTSGVDFLAGFSPLLNPKNNRERGLKNLERASIFAVTAGSMGVGWPITCTARNMAYRRSVYDAVGGFGPIGAIRSGDDDLMLQRLGPHLRRMRFVYSPRACVPSQDSAGTAKQTQVEVRRGSKWRHYPFALKMMSLLVMLYFLTLGAYTVFAAFGVLPLSSALYAWEAKTLVEAGFLLCFLHRVKRTHLLAWYPLAALAYIPYFVYFGLRGTFGRYRWKN